jgi:tetratricopeptide (TPR) repeat protein
MRKARNNNNFIDKTFTIIADVLLRVFPASQQEKKAFSYYLNGLSAQDEGEYAEALNNYYQALQIEEDLYDRSIILYNIGLIYSKNGIKLMLNGFCICFKSTLYFLANSENISLDEDSQNLIFSRHIMFKSS